jgi:hypothetical protein
VYDRMRSERQQQESSANATDDATNVPRGGGTGPWRGNVLYMRIIMCQTEDALKSLFLAQANTPLREELDARNSSCRLVCATLLVCIMVLFFSFILLLLVTLLY